MDKKTRGAWTIHHTQKIQNFLGQTGFTNIYSAGKTGILLSALSASEESTLTLAQAKALAHASNISPLELPTILGNLENRHLIAIAQEEVHVLGLTPANTLQHTSDILDATNPTPEELASLDLSERVTVQPCLEREIAEEISDLYQLTSAKTKDLLDSAERLGFVDAEPLDDSTRFLFNGNLFRQQEARKIKAVLDSLSPADTGRISDVEELLSHEGAAELARAKKLLGTRLFQKLHAIGLYDVSEIANDTESVLYLTRPAAFQKFGNPFVEDALDLAKALVVSLKYGMTRSTRLRGKIRILPALVTKLLRDEWVGPAPAIGQDYRYLETRRVIETRKDYPGSYSMRLLKKEIGALALQVLISGDASEHGLVDLPEAAVNRYSNPETTRALTRRGQARGSKRQTAELLNIIRTGAS